MRPLPFIAALFVLWSAAPAARPDAHAPSLETRTAVVNDTIRTAVQAGEPLIVALPREHAGREASYRVLHAPALSWLVDRSFYWRTLPAERGLLYVLFERTAPGVAPDTLVLAVEIVGG